MKYFFYLCVLAMLIGMSAPSTAAQTFTVTDIGAASGFSSSTGVSINNRGHILLQASGQYYVFSNGAAQPLMGSPSQVGNINDKDQVAGAGFINGFYHAGLYTTNSVTDLEAAEPYQFQYSAAYGVNRYGHCYLLLAT